MHSGTQRLILLLVVCLVNFLLVAAEAGKAELTGEVRDQNGAIVSQSQVTITEITTAQTFSTSAVESGNYTITGIKPGTYKITVEAAGFKRFVREGVRLATGERVRLDVVLEPGTVTETVTVNQDASLLRTESGSLGQVISNRKIVD